MNSHKLNYNPSSFDFQKINAFLSEQRARQKAYLEKKSTFYGFDFIQERPLEKLPKNEQRFIWEPIIDPRCKDVFELKTATENKNDIDIQANSQVQDSFRK